jgi:hypothetical protein
LTWRVLVSTVQVAPWLSEKEAVIPVPVDANHLAQAMIRLLAVVWLENAAVAGPVA